MAREEGWGRGTGGGGGAGDPKGPVEAAKGGGGLLLGMGAWLGEVGEEEEGPGG